MTKVASACGAVARRALGPPQRAGRASECRIDYAAPTRNPEAPLFLQFLQAADSLRSFCSTIRGDRRTNPHASRESAPRESVVLVATSTNLGEPVSHRSVRLPVSVDMAGRNPTPIDPPNNSRRTRRPRHPPPRRVRGVSVSRRSSLPAPAVHPRAPGSAMPRALPQVEGKPDAHRASRIRIGLKLSFRSSSRRRAHATFFRVRKRPTVHLVRAPTRRNCASLRRPAVTRAEHLGALSVCSAALGAAYQSCRFASRVFHTCGPSFVPRSTVYS